MVVNLDLEIPVSIAHIVGVIYTPETQQTRTIERYTCSNGWTSKLMSLSVTNRPIVQYRVSSGYKFNPLSLHLIVVAVMYHCCSYVSLLQLRIIVAVTYHCCSYVSLLQLRIIVRLAVLY